MDQSDPKQSKVSGRTAVSAFQALTPTQLTVGRELVAGGATEVEVGILRVVVVGRDVELCTDVTTVGRGDLVELKLVLMMGIVVEVVERDFVDVDTRVRVVDEDVVLGCGDDPPVIMFLMARS